MKRMNWGWGISAFYVGFVVFMLCLVWMASANKVEMVTTDYYKKELGYQSHIDKVNNSAKLKEPLKWTVSGNQVTLIFPEEVSGQIIGGEVLFYRPANSANDFTTQIEVNDGVCIITSDKFVRGAYRMKINWKVNDTDYYNEGVININ